MGFGQNGPTVLRLDNQEAIALGENPMISEKAKHTKLRCHVVGNNAEMDSRDSNRLLARMSVHIFLQSPWLKQHSVTQQTQLVLDKMVCISSRRRIAVTNIITVFARCIHNMGVGKLPSVV